jgi:NTP pyrophosphatase (non-canonical NTP hydrolase)
MRLIKLEKTADLVIKYNTKEKNVLKVVEECTELNEVLIKTLTKQPEDKPPMSKVIEEMGDTLARCYILARQLGIENEVEERVLFKFQQLDGWMKKKYEGTV